MKKRDIFHKVQISPNSLRPRLNIRGLKTMTGLIWMYQQLAIIYLS